MILTYRRLLDKGSSDNEVEFLEVGVSKNRVLKRPNALVCTNDSKIEYILTIVKNIKVTIKSVIILRNLILIYPIPYNLIGYLITLISI